MLRYLPYLLVLALVIYAFIDCLNTPEAEIRSLPKVVWVLIILLFGEVLIGPLVWFLVGKRRYVPAVTGAPFASWVPPDDNPEFLRSLGDDELRRREQDTDDTP